VELSTVIRQAIEASQPLIDAAGHRLRVTLPAEPIHLHADPARLTQVFANLLNNSIKYTRHGDHRARAQCEGDQVRVSVKDSGIGIRRQARAHLRHVHAGAQRSSSRKRGWASVDIGEAPAADAWRIIEARSDGESGSESSCRLPRWRHPGDSRAARPLRALRAAASWWWTTTPTRRCRWRCCWR
jgi:light-regulated signal transduction histidine kinase (bacteriophytochrome)